MVTEAQKKSTEMGGQLMGSLSRRCSPRLCLAWIQERTESDAQVSRDVKRKMS